MPQGRLAQVLRELESDRDDPRLAVGPQTLDDAGVVLLGREEGLPAGTTLALVQTVDFFPPVVDDPELYGAIAAANALSDVFAMGGRALSALTIASFPKEFPAHWIGTILRGGFAKVREAGAVVAGGHTVEGEVQFGFAVTGLVDPTRVAANAGARAGDVAYLTKPLGMGVMTTSAKKQEIDQATLLPAALQMATLNDKAADAMRAVDFHACTDITGFGLCGHGRNVAKASGVTLRVRLSDVPFFPGSEELARRGLFSGGSARGRAALADEVSIGAGLPEHQVGILFDAETSGGLLIVVPEAEASRLEGELRARALPVACIGEFVADAGVALELL